jgi:hypothetical protein
MARKATDNERDHHRTREGERQALQLLDAFIERGQLKRKIESRTA